MTVPKNIKTIENFTFKNCKAFTRISIPDGVTSIGVTAFASCDNLEYLYVPKSVTEIVVDFMGNTPFYGSSKLTVFTPAGSEAQKFATQKGIPYENTDKSKVTNDNTNAKSIEKDNSSKINSDDKEEVKVHYESREELRAALQEKGIDPDFVAVTNDPLPAGTIIDVNKLCPRESITNLRSIIDYAGTLPITAEEAIGKTLNKKLKALTRLSREFIREYEKKEEVKVHYESREELRAALQEKGIDPDFVAVTNDPLPAGTIIDVNKLCPRESLSNLHDFIDYSGTPITAEEAIGKTLKKRIRALKAITEKDLIID